MNVFEAIILGLVQGVTEFLPISSSGHLVLFQNMLGLHGDHFSFDVFLHLSSLFAILVFFRKKLFSITFGEIKLIAIGTVPAVIVGFLLKDSIGLLFSSTIMVGFTLLITAAFNFLSAYLLLKQADNKKEGNDSEDKSNIEKQEVKLPIHSAIIIGFFQALAIIPGISRSGSTLLGGISQNLARRSAFDFAFLLAIPAILGASILEFIDIYLEGVGLVYDPSNYLAGGLASFLSGLLSLGIFSFVLKKAKLQWFGWYCLFVSIGSFLFII